MTLAMLSPIGFVPIHKAEEARSFYEQTLGLHFESDDTFAMIFRVGGSANLMLRLVRMPASFTPVSHTIFGWETTDIEATIDQLTAKGVAFVRYGFFEQDARGIWRSPGGAKVAWFKDPDGNNLSLSQHAAA